MTTGIISSVARAEARAVA